MPTATEAPTQPTDFHPDPSGSPWLRRAVQFVASSSAVGAGAITLADLRPLFALAPSGALATTVDALCRAGCLIALDETRFALGPNARPRPSKPSLRPGRTR